jgi:hypothetical protein
MTKKQTRKSTKGKPRPPQGSGPRCCLCNESIRRGRMCRMCKVERSEADTLRASARLPLFDPHPEQSTPAQQPQRGRGAA